MPPTVPLCDTTAQYRELKDSVDDALLSVAASGNYILGDPVREFERQFCEYTGAKFAVGVGNGTDALHLALRALGIGPGDEVITTPFTFIATVEAIMLVGATPVFVDINHDTFNIDPAKLAVAVTARTRAIMPVHLYGLPAAMPEIRQVARNHDLLIVEDCAQALGARSDGRMVGTIGDVGCYSFFPSKNLGCLGDGGMVVTDDEAVYERLEMLRRHGGKIKYHHQEVGLNSRLDAIQAAVLSVKLPRLDDWNRMRDSIAERYLERLAMESLIQLPAPPSPEKLHVWHQFTLLTNHRAELSKLLSTRGVACFPYYPVPLHLQEVTRHLGYQRGDFPNAENAADRCLSLPMFPHLSLTQQAYVIEQLRDALAQLRSSELTRNPAA
ncbi:MAG: DegT/DnrJ/EryC1/StrS family aminotransferase [Candidatus Paceibacterota bacterium]